MITRSVGFLGFLAGMILVVSWSAANGVEPVVGWRNDGSGHFSRAKPPQTWATSENIVWKTELADRSLASPIVAGGRVFVLAEPTELVCLAADDGALAWQRSHSYTDVFGQEKGEAIETDLAKARQLHEEINQLNRRRREAEQAGDEDAKATLQSQIEKMQQQRDALTAVYRQLPGGNTANTGCTPTSDGQNVFALFGTGVVSSHTLEGRRNWMTFVEGATGDQSASPILAGDKLIVHLRQLHALDARTGKLIWTAKVDSRHGSPVVAKIGDTSVVVTPSGAVVRLSDGEILARNLFRLGHCSPIVHDGVAYALENGAIKAVKLSTQVDSSKVIWESESSRTNRLASPIYAGGLLYGVTEQGVLEVHDAKSGQRVYRKRLGFSGGRLDPSMCVAGGLLFITNNQGTTFVLKPGREYEQIARNELRADFSSSPAFDGEAIYIRTRKHVICIGR